MGSISLKFPLDLLEDFRVVDTDLDTFSAGGIGPNPAPPSLPGNREITFESFSSFFSVISVPRSSAQHQFMPVRGADPRQGANRAAYQPTDALIARPG